MFLLGAFAVASAVLTASVGGSAHPAGRQRVGSELRAQQLNVNFAGHHAYPFRLADAWGRVLDERQLRGRPYAITFLYTHCMDTCPLLGAELQQALKLLGAASRNVAVVGVSVDPTGDTPGNVRAWLRRLREPGSFHYLLGSERQLAPVWNSYFIDEQQPGFNVGTHTSEVYLVDARGLLRGVYEANVPIDPHDIAHDLRALARRRWRPSPGG